MKKKISGVQALLSFAAFMVLVGTGAPVLQHKYGVPPLLTFAVAVVAVVCMALVQMFRESKQSVWFVRKSHNDPWSFGGAQDDTHIAAVQVEKWVPYIIERLWKNNMFLNRAWSDDEYVVNNSLVHIPQPGSAPTVSKNNGTYPVAAVQRTDTDITYGLDAYTTAPSLIPQVDVDDISYDKIASIIEDHYGFLYQNMADDMLYKWTNGLPGANIISTLGAATAATVSGQTGNRLAMTYRELQLARLALNKQNIPAEGREAIIQSDMLDQMINSLSLTQYRDFSREYDASSGSIGTLFGFNITERSTTATIQAALSGGNAVANDFETVAAATDNVACLCYHKNAVTRAIGEKRMFQRPNDPLYYGDIYSMLIRMGGQRRRADNAGIVAIVQAGA